MIDRPCRWGILGAANIARKNWQAIRDAGNATLVAVASRDVTRAAAFVTECQAHAPYPKPPDALGSYEALLRRTDVDAVYVPLPTGLRAAWVLRAIAAGKHVLVEKPAGANEAEVRAMVAAAGRQRVQFMDGVMFMHSLRLQRLHEVLAKEQRIGDIRHIASQFSFAGDAAFLGANIRTHGQLEPLGCLGDLGWYCLRFTLWALGFELPVRVTGHLCAEHQQAGGLPSVPLEFSGHLTFARGVSASYHCSFTACNAQWAVISGTRGLVRIEDFVLPFFGTKTRFDVTQSEFIVKGCQFEMQEHREQLVVEEPSNNAPATQEARMFRTFSEQVRSGRLDALWPDLALKTQQVLDACLESARQGSRPVALRG